MEVDQRLGAGGGETVPNKLEVTGTAESIESVGSKLLIQKRKDRGKKKIKPVGRHVHAYICAIPGRSRRVLG